MFCTIYCFVDWILREKRQNLCWSVHILVNRLLSITFLRPSLLQNRLRELNALHLPAGLKVPSKNCRPVKFIFSPFRTSVPFYTASGRKDGWLTAKQSQVFWKYLFYKCTNACEHAVRLQLRDTPWDSSRTGGLSCFHVQLSRNCGNSFCLTCSCCIQGAPEKTIFLLK